MNKRENLDLVIQDLENMAEDFYYGHKSLNAALSILNNGVPETKEDYVTQVLQMDNRIKTIDYAVPIQIYSPCQKLGINTDMWVSVYWKAIEGQGIAKMGIMDIRSYWAHLNNNI